MELFTHAIESLRIFIDSISPKKSCFEKPFTPWPEGGSRNIVLAQDMGLELVSPQLESVSWVLWTGNVSAIEDGKTTLIGPDFFESVGKSLPFGKVVLAGVEGFTEDNAYERHKELEYLRYNLDLQGFMMRAVSQYMKEWCRISRDALSNGFSAQILGRSLINHFREKPYVRAVEVIIFTSSTADIKRLREITAPAEKIISAMNKMISETDHECGTCDYQNVCDEVDGLKVMREKLIDKSKGRLHGGHEDAVMSQGDVDGIKK
jgi:CO dehydrogenase/acetyl-CoA synthase beta subunit